MSHGKMGWRGMVVSVITVFSVGTSVAIAINGIVVVTTHHGIISLVLHPFFFEGSYHEKQYSIIR